MRFTKRFLLSAALALPMTLGFAAPSYADPVDVQLGPCPQGYTGVKVVVIINGQPTGVVVCQNIRPF
jgi:hypothetical protein